MYIVHKYYVLFLKCESICNTSSRTPFESVLSVLTTEKCCCCCCFIVYMYYCRILLLSDDRLLKIHLEKIVICPAVIRGNKKEMMAIQSLFVAEILFIAPLNQSMKIGAY